MKVIEKAFVFVDNKGKYPRYFTILNKKESDDTKSSFFVDVKFAKKCPVKLIDADSTYEIDIKDGFLSFDSWLDKNNVEKKKATIVILDATIVSAKKNESK